MSLDNLIAALPEFAAFVRRDGEIIEHAGGRSLGVTAPPGLLNGSNITGIWLGTDGAALLQAVRKALSTREPVECRFEASGRQLEARLAAEGPDRVLCLVRDAHLIAASEDDRDPDSADETPTAVNRRGFLKRFQQSVADAALRERALSVCLVYLDGLPDIGRTIDYTIAEKVVTAALQRLPSPGSCDEPSGVKWYLGQLGDAFLAVVIEGSTGRDIIQQLADRLGGSLRAPVPVGDATFTLRPSIGVALLGTDANRPQALLECARAAMTEARRAGAREVQFYSDTMHLRPMVRLDVERELREAITNDELQLRYVGRHDLDTGRLEAVHAYLRWPTRLQGDVPPSRFLPIAENTGLALQMSQWALARLCQDWQTLRAPLDAAVRISFGALRHHLIGDTLASDLESLAAARALDPALLEIRISENTLAALANPEETLGRLTSLGARVVIDEIGRSSCSLARLSQLPIYALQVDRSYVIALHEVKAAARVCRGLAGLAQGLGIRSFAAGVDDQRRRELMLEAGFTQGLGDHYPGLPALGGEDEGLLLTG